MKNLLFTLALILMAKNALLLPSWFRSKLASFAPNPQIDYKKSAIDTSTKYSYQRDDKYSRPIIST